ncbi:MAG: pyruvate:ferredoxin (flavodoxin) oxidoreductase [Polyangiaceae bacterium]|nr:pyruvate:ferredoxin (flavodoxin) oxidoreductase [Polyangiaceae bacterium]
MSTEQTTIATIDANEAVASVAHRSSEVIAIYPITPASSMGEFSDQWSTDGQKNLWGAVPRIVQMQSEGGAAGAVHGALQTGALTTTFTASQGLLLMIPNMYKIAGELNSCVIHVAARTVASHALSIFCDHSDVMACRQTGFALLCSSSGQEAQDLAAIAHAATLEARIPYLHFFDGFRTSAEITKIETLSDDDLRALYNDELLAAHRARALSPDKPVLRGTAQNPDVFFQAREASNPFYDACAEITQQVMDRFAARTGRAYKLFDYVGHPEAERVLVLMGSAAETAHETVEHLNDRGEKVGIVKVRLYRPFDVRAMISALPKTARILGVLDRTKEPGAIGEPLYLDVTTAVAEARAEGFLDRDIRVVGGRYGLSSKEVTPAMIMSVFDELARPKPRNHFTIGIVDDVTHRSLPWDSELDIEKKDVVRAVFFGLGSDGTVGSNKQSIKIIGEETPNFAQGFFVYDSKKSGTVTVSHLRFGPRRIRSAYLVKKAGFVACHQPQFLDRFDMLAHADEGATFLLNSHHDPSEVWDTLPREVQEAICSKHLRFFIIDAYRVAEDSGLGRHISTVMQVCFFALSGVLPRDEAIARIKASAEKAYKKRGEEVVRKNHLAIDNALARLHEVTVPAAPSAARQRPPIVPAHAPDFVQRVTATILAGKGDLLPVSAFPPDGTWPLGTTQWEKRGIALKIPIWDSSICIQCNKCALMCPHAAIRAKVFDVAALADAPDSFKAVPYKDKGEGVAGKHYTIQVAPDDCTGCELCVTVCPAKDKSNPRHKAIDMQPKEPHLATERRGFDFFLGLPEPDKRRVRLDVKGSQLFDPLFEFSGACAGCGETPYIKLVTQLFGDRMVIANATGCTSIYGGNLPTTPYRTNAEGRGPAWSNSLFEDNAEFGLGMRLGLDARALVAVTELLALSSILGDELVKGLVEADQSTESGIAAQRERVAMLKQKLERVDDVRARRLERVADDLVKKSVWIIGGDGWAYDIGYGGLDHVLAGTDNVNLLVLDTEVYSNTGGQQSKATPIGAAAKFAAAGKSIAKKDLGMLAMTYGHAYVASIAMGAKDAHAIKAIEEAESYPGPSLIIAYSHCIAHGYDLAHGAEQQKLAVESGLWPLYRFDPRRIAKGEPPLVLDSGPIKAKVRDYMKNEGRFRMVELQDPKRYATLVQAAEQNAFERRGVYEQLAGLRVPMNTKTEETHS